MSGSIHLGYVVGTGEPVEIPLRHTAVTGQTQESGKTTTLEGLIARSGQQAIAYVTKRGESSFHVMHPIPPYFQERADWKFVQSLLEASTESKLKFEQSWIMRASEGAKTLEDVRANIRKYLNGVKAPPLVVKKGPQSYRHAAAEPKERWLQKPARGLSGDIYYVLNKYLDDIMPALASLPYSNTLDLADGLNVMDLRDYEFPLQCLVMRSVTDRIREHEEGTVNIIPEAWKFAPKQRGTPVRLAAEEYIREAAAMKNFLWIDSQDLAGVADVLMRQVGVWLFGVQRAKHEIERALDHMPEGLPVRRPRPADIATLSKGQFYVCFGREMHKVYVQPAWMTAAHAEAIARGEEEVDSAREILREYANEHIQRSAGKRDQASNKRGASSNAGMADTEGIADGHLSSRAAGHVTGQTSRGHSDGRYSDGKVSETSSPREMRKDREQTRTDIDAGRDRQPAQPQTASASPIARDARELAQDGDREEAMWKEKYEALKAEFEEYRNGVAQDAAAANGRVLDVPGNGMRVHFKPHSPQDVNELLDVLLTRARKDPAVIQLLRERPEIHISVKRRTLEMSDESTDGRLALLISQKFFDTPQDGGTITKEFKRRGWFDAKSSNAAVIRPLAKITEMGFLVREGNQYQAVAGMKINIVEA